MEASMRSVMKKEVHSPCPNMGDGRYMYLGSSGLFHNTDLTCLRVDPNADSVASAHQQNQCISSINVSAPFGKTGASAVFCDDLLSCTVDPDF